MLTIPPLTNQPKPSNREGRGRGAVRGVWLHHTDLQGGKSWTFLDWKEFVKRQKEVGAVRGIWPHWSSPLFAHLSACLQFSACFPRQPVSRWGAHDPSSNHQNVKPGMMIISQAMMQLLGFLKDLSCNTSVALWANPRFLGVCTMRVFKPGHEKLASLDHLIGKSLGQLSILPSLHLFNPIQLQRKAQVQA